jgi:hypothetical protein
MERRKVLDDATRENITEFYKSSLEDMVEDRLVPKTRLRTKMKKYLKVLGFHNSEEIKPVNRIKENAVTAVENYLDTELRTLMKTIGTVMLIQDKQTVKEEDVFKAIAIIKERRNKKAGMIVTEDIVFQALGYKR